MNDTPNRSSAPPTPHTDGASDTAGPEGTGNPLADAAPSTDRSTLIGPGAPEYFTGFVVLQKLGAGGMGTVYLAEDLELKRKVAIKTMQPAIAADPTNFQRFVREARVAATVEHENLVPIQQFGKATDGTPFIVMPFLRGESLDARLKRESGVSLGLVLKVALEVAKGLTAAHAVGLVHRDIKPANIWLEGDQAAHQVKRCKILDFGLARPVAPTGDAELTTNRAIMGTPAYMAPEQARSQPVDHRADLFSLGVVLYRMATGRLPFTGASEFDVMAAVVAHEPPAACVLVPGVPPALSDLIGRLMSKDRDTRPQSAAEVVAVVRDLIKQLKEQKRLTDPIGNAQPVVDPNSTSQPQLLVEEEDAESERAAGPIDVKRKRLRHSWVTAPAGSSGEREEKGARRASRGLLWPIAAAVGALVVIPLGLLLSGAFDKKREAAPSGELAKKESPSVVVPEPAPKPATATDRAAAEWVLRNGGSVQINGETRKINAGGLPMETFRLTGIHIIDNQRMAGADLSVFQGCKHLTHIEFDGSNVGDDEVVHFKHCNNLRVLDLGNTQVGNKGFAYFKDCKNLVELDLESTGVDDTAVDQIKSYKQLKLLDLRETRISPERVAEIRNAIPKWDQFDADPPVAPKADPDRKAATYVLLIGGCVSINGGDEQISDVKKLPGSFQLTAIYLIENTQVRDAGLAAFAGCRHLTHVGLSGTQTGDAGLAHFKDCKDLMYLYLKGTQITSAGLTAMKDCTQLLELDISYTKVDDASLDTVKRFKQLSFLFLKQTQVTANGEAALKKALPKCEITSDESATADRKAAKWVIDAGGHVKVDDQQEQINTVEKLPKEPFKLTAFGFYPYEGTGDWAVFAKCVNLTSINIRDTPGFKNADLLHFKGCKNLTELKLQNTGLNDEAVGTLKQFSKLTRLDVEQTKITPKGAHELAKALPQCQITWEGGILNFKKK